MTAARLTGCARSPTSASGSICGIVNEASATSAVRVSATATSAFGTAARTAAAGRAMALVVSMDGPGTMSSIPRLDVQPPKARQAERKATKPGRRMTNPYAQQRIGRQRLNRAEPSQLLTRNYQQTLNAGKILCDAAPSQARRVATAPAAGRIEAHHVDTVCLGRKAASAVTRAGTAPGGIQKIINPGATGTGVASGRS